MNHERKELAGPVLVLALFIATAATLRYAQEFFLPLVLAGLLSFLLSPLVRALERLRIGRVGAVLLTTAFAFFLLAGLSYLLTRQFLDLAGSLPKYRSNLIARVEALEAHKDNPLRLGAQTVREVTEALSQQGEKVVGPNGQTKPPPARVEIVQPPEGPIQTLLTVMWPVISPLAHTLVVIVIVIFMLMAGDDLRDRLLHLIGRAQLRVTTQALDDVAQRISRYLRAQVMVNACFGVSIGCGLYLIGIPNPVFWGLLAMVLRFLPYIGAWLAAALPLALSLAVFSSWTQPLLVIGLFVAIELLVANFIEPLLYGATTAISPLAVVVSALFWTWLWGGVGLVLATPLTVCLAVAGRYLPDLAFLDLLIGEKPSITPADRLYQRLLALHEEEVSETIEHYANEHSLLAAFDDAVLPALRSIEEDFRAGLLSETARRDACEILRQTIADLGQPLPATDNTPAPIICIPANHEVDELVAMFLAKVLAGYGISAQVLSAKLLAAEAIQEAATLAPPVICISSMPPASTIAARSICTRLRARLPSTRIIVGLWQPDDAEFAARRERMQKAGANEAYADLGHATASLRELAGSTSQPALGNVGETP